jgi:hypothetical protein
MNARARRFDRRHALKLGAQVVSLTALARLASACGGSSSSTSSPLDGPISESMSIVQRWVPDQLGPGVQRLPVSLADDQGLLLVGPEQLTGKIVNYLDDSIVADNLIAVRRSLGPDTAPFWVFEAAIARDDVYALLIDGGPSDGASLQVRDVADLVVPRPGDRLPPFDTPTFDDDRGVAKVCTRSPEPCPFHTTTLTDALASGSRVVYIVGTPAHCQTGVCAPILDGMIPLADEFTDTVFVHADVYADVAATDVAPAVQDLSLTFEPVVFVTDDAGIITQRFEGVWHPDEVRAILS